MTLRRLLTLALLLSPLAASAHNFVHGRPVAPIAIADRGELLLRNGDFSYRPWNSAKLAGKVRVIQYIAGRTSAKKKNSLLINAVKDANLPGDR
ncbi:TPA: YtfJ family protein, partial [Serratia marcescens]|nr:YtfJ family protein [Serratia marcescens]